MMLKIALIASLLIAAASATCSTYSGTSCSSCVNSGSCGWCSSTLVCSPGSSSGPSSGYGYCSYSYWNYWSSDCTSSVPSCYPFCGSSYYSSSVGLGAGVIAAIVIIPLVIIIGSIVACCVCCGAAASQPRSTVIMTQQPGLQQPMNQGYVQQGQYPQQYPQPQNYAPVPQQQCAPAGGVY